MVVKDGLGARSQGDEGMVVLLAAGAMTLVGLSSVYTRRFFMIISQVIDARRKQNASDTGGRLSLGECGSVRVYQRE